MSAFAAAVLMTLPALPVQESALGRLLREKYTKSEHLVPMRDGVHLFTAVYRPRDTSREVPILLCRTPYGIAPYGEEQFNPWFLGPSEAPEHLRDGYAFVYQDVRGRMMSEGEFVPMRPLSPDAANGSLDVDAIDERTDAWDTIDWLLENVPGHNGRVGTWGGSYDGFYATCTALSGHPALHAALIQGPQTDWYFEDFHQGGILCLADAFDFLSTWGWPHANPTSEPPRGYQPEAEDGYAFFLGLGSPAALDLLHFRGRVAFWNELVEHPDRDAFWQDRDVLPHVRGVQPATLVVGGWYDHNNLRGALALHRALVASDPRTPPRLVVGPWAHGAWQNRESRDLGRLDFGQPTARLYREEVEIPFLRAHLRGTDADPGPQVRVFDTGTLAWRSFDVWPPAESRAEAWHLAPAGSLATMPPPGGQPGAAHDVLPSDPAAPVPAWIEASLSVPETYVTLDQRFVEGRPDVLVYRSPVLDTAYTAAGPVLVDLWISSEEAEDCILVVKLIDELPPEDDAATGDARLVRWGALSARHREGFAQAVPLPPGEVVRLGFELLDVLHTFQPGHRIQVQVQPGLFPILARNPQTWLENPLRAEAEDYRAAELRIHRAAPHASSLRVGDLRGEGPASELPGED